MASMLFLTELPLLDRRGSCAIKRMVRSIQSRADGMIVQETSPGQPSRRFAPPLLSRRGNCPLSSQRAIPSHLHRPRLKQKRPPSLSRTAFFIPDKT